MNSRACNSNEWVERIQGKKEIQKEESSSKLPVSPDGISTPITPEETGTQ